MNRAEAIRTIAGGLFALKNWDWSALIPVAYGRPAAPTEGRVSGELVERPAPTVSLIGTEVDPAAKTVYVEVRLSAPVVNTVVLTLVTRNGSDLIGARRAIEGYQFKRATQIFVFRPGDDPFGFLSVPLLGGQDGQWFEVIIPDQVDGARHLVDVARVTFRTGATNSARPVRQRPSRIARRGAQTFQMDLATFKASETGFINGRPCWRSRFSHGRTQQNNHELGLYTDPSLYPGTRPFEVRDGNLVLRVEKLPAPIFYEPERRNYAFGSSVLTTEKLHSQTYGYFEWDARLPWARGTWPGFWLLPTDGTWPPEIDVMEAPRNGGYGKSDSNAAMHWLTGGEHRSASSRLSTAKILGAPINLVDEFHRHAVEWREDYTTWFIDEQEVWQTPTRFHKPVYALMDMTLGGWGGPPDLTTGSTEMLVRNFRIWA